MNYFDARQTINQLENEISKTQKKLVVGTLLLEHLNKQLRKVRENMMSENWKEIEIERQNQTNL